MLIFSNFLAKVCFETLAWNSSLEFLQNSITKIYIYYKLGQACVKNWGSFVLLQIRANVVTNWGSCIITNQGKFCYKLKHLLQIRQPLLQNRAAITNWGKMYYKLGQVLQIRTIITTWAQQQQGRILDLANFLNASDKIGRWGFIIFRSQGRTS